MSYRPDPLQLTSAWWICSTNSELKAQTKKEDMAHTHELFYRCKHEDGTVTLNRFASHSRNSTEAGEDLIQLIDNLAKEKKHLTESRDAILYKIDGLCEYMISREFYLWPNVQEHHGKNTGKGRERRDRYESRGARGTRTAQQRPA